MKRIIYLLVIVGAIFIGCNPIEDIYNEIDAQDNSVIGSAEYTLTSEDYDDLDLPFGNFGSVEDAKAALPDFISGLYPHFGTGSTVLIGYDLYIGNAEGLSDFTDADTYQFENSDYALTGSDAFGFYPNVDPTDEIPTVLDAQIASPVEGQIVLAEYKQYFENPEIGLTNLYEAAFPADYGNFENIDLFGAQGWTEGPNNVQGSGYDGGAMENEDWFVSPEIDLTGQSGLLFQITQEIDFLGDPNLIDIVVSTNFTTGGDVTAATWTVLDFDKTIYGSMTTSEDFDFSAYDGQVIHVAFRYNSTDSDSPRWRVQSFAIKAVGISGDTDSKGEFFMYSGGSWEANDGVYYLSASDYDSMGEDSGQPGRYNNFSSSTRAENYLPQFLDIKYPFAQEEDEIFMIYKYFSGSSGLGTRGNLYTFTNGEWVGHENVISTTLQFGYDGTEWVPDNTIRYTFTSSDISFISDAFSTIYPGPADNVGFFGSFDRRPSSDNFWSDDMLLEAFNALLENGNFVTMEEQKYVLTYIIYNGATAEESMSVIKTGGVWIYQ